MRSLAPVILLFLFLAPASVVMAQKNPPLAMAEMLAYTARFNPYDTRQMVIIENLSPDYLVRFLKTNDEKNAFWLNIYNSYMYRFLTDTSNHGLYTTFYKKKNVKVAGKMFSLFDIEHEFLLSGCKMKQAGFRRPAIYRDTTWRKLRTERPDLRVIFCMYRGLYGYPPFQSIENADLQSPYDNALKCISKQDTGCITLCDWVKPYKSLLQCKPDVAAVFSQPVCYERTPLAVQVKNFYPRYEGVRFKEEESNPWLKN